MLRTASSSGRKRGKGVVFADHQLDSETKLPDVSEGPLVADRSQEKEVVTPSGGEEHEEAQAQFKQKPHLPARTPPTPESVAKSRASSSRQLLSRLRSERLLVEDKPHAKPASAVFTFAPTSSHRQRRRADHNVGKVEIVNIKEQTARPRSGFHEHVFSNQDKYAGDWMCGMLTGEGEYTKKGGKESYAGTWVNDTLDGFGEHREPTGRTYLGNFKEGVRHGRGRLRLPLQTMLATGEDKALEEDDDDLLDGRKKAPARLGPRQPAGTGTVGGAGEGFECEWRAGKMVGKANRMWYKLYDEKTGLPLEGEQGRTLEGYVNTLNQPTGPIQRPEASRRYDLSAGGRRYEFPAERGGYHPLLDPPFRPHSPRTSAMLSKQAAVYKDGAMQGWGDAKTARDDGDEVYDGEEKMCLDGVKRRYGKGTARWGPEGREVYSGDWLYNQKHGKGERIWANGEVYNGTWTHGRMHGKGSYRWSGGAKYNGEFVKGRRSGRGVQVWPAEGRGGVMEYDGGWHQDKREGWGRLRYPDGREYVGEWRAGRMKGRGTLTYANGWTYEGAFYADMKHGDGTRTEWYDRGQGRQFAVRYQYNVLQFKRDLGPASRGSSRSSATGASDLEGSAGGLVSRSALVTVTTPVSGRTFETTAGALSPSSSRRHGRAASVPAEDLVSTPAHRSLGGTTAHWQVSTGTSRSPALSQAQAGPGPGARGSSLNVSSQRGAVPLLGAEPGGDASAGEGGGGGGGGGGAVPRLHLQGAIEQGSLPLSPPRSPPFSPTDNNQDAAADDDAMRYPAGNWTYGERTEREEDAELASMTQSTW